MQHVISCPEMQAWMSAAKAETEIVAADEAGIDR